MPEYAHFLILTPFLDYLQFTSCVRSSPDYLNSVLSATNAVKLALNVSYGSRDFLVWIHLRQVALEAARTVYQVEHQLLNDYMREQLRSPSAKMLLAV